MTGRTTGRGYGAPHQRLRKRWAPIVAAGGVVCPRCQQPITRGQTWHLGHKDGTAKQAYSGPEHSACNLAASNDGKPARDPAPQPRTKW